MGERTVLLVEPFFTGSHQAWAEGWRQASRHDVHVLAGSGMGWRRSMRTGSTVLTDRAAEWVATHGLPDLVVGTNMLDLASFLGLSRRLLGPVAAVQFMHENQFSYPRQVGEPLDSGLAWMQWRSLVVADEIWCNSEYHRRSLLDGLTMLDDGAETVVDADAIESKMWVGHLGIDVDACRRAVPASGPRRPLVVSNQRWHHDKDLGSVLRAIRTALEQGFDCEVALLGDPMGGEADALAPLIDELGDAVVVRGHLPRHEYLDVLRRADVVVSAARNENFGLAVVEAIAAGAWPVVPAALAYPEVVPSEFHGSCLYEPGGLGVRLREVLGRIAAGEASPVGLAESMARFDWAVVARALDERVERLLRRRAAV